MQTLLDAAVPMVALLWRRETEGRVFDSPERRAALDKSLREAIRRIQRPVAAPPLRGRGRTASGASCSRRSPAALPRPARRPAAPAARGDTRRQGLAPRATAASRHADDDQLREAVILATLVTHPDLVRRFEGDLERMEPLTPEHARVLSALLSIPVRSDAVTTSNAARDRMPLKSSSRLRHVQISPGVRNADDSATRDGLRARRSWPSSPPAAGRGARSRKRRTTSQAWPTKG